MGLSYFMCIQSEYDRRFACAFNLEMGDAPLLGSVIVTYTV